MLPGAVRSICKPYSRCCCLSGRPLITIRLDEDIIDHFAAIADASGGLTGYQTLINSALREYIEGKAPKIEDALRRIVREELGRAS